MTVIKIILIILGLLKLADLICLVLAHIYCRIKGIKANGVARHSCISFDAIEWIDLIPTISFCYNERYFEIKFSWLVFTYYSSYCLDLDVDEE